MDIKLLTLPSCNWTEYIKLCQKTLGFSPSRIIDEKRIPLESPRALLLSLSYVFNGSTVIDDKVLRIIDLHFLITGTFKQICKLQNYCSYKFITLESGGAELCLAKAAIEKWRTVVIEGSMDKDFEIRRACNLIYLALVHAELSEIFNLYTKIENPDQTFYFKRR